MGVITKRFARNVFISCTRQDDSSSHYYYLHRIFCQHVSSRFFVGKDGMILKLSDKRFEIWRRFEFVTVLSCLLLGKIQSYSWSENICFLCCLGTNFRLVGPCIFFTLNNLYQPRLDLKDFSYKREIDGNHYKWKR